MKPLSWDTETALIRPARLAPPLVCVSWQTSGEPPRLEHHATVEPLFRSWLEDPEILFIAHNGAFDFAVIAECFPHLVPLIFAAYGANRITDTKLREQLLDIAGGRFRWHPTEKGKGVRVDYDLAGVARRRTGRILKKDGFRFFYGLLRDTPIRGWIDRAKEIQAAARVTQPGDQFDDYRSILGSKWDDAVRGLIEADPSEVISYPLEDAVAPLEVYEAQEEHADELDDQFRQARAAWWLHLSSTWGLRTTAEGVRTLKTRTEQRYNELEAELIETGLVRPDGSRDTKAAKRLMIEVCTRDDLPIRRTDTHGSPGKCKDLDGNVLPDGDEACAEHVSLDEESCKNVAEYSPELSKYSEATTLKKVLSNNVPALERGIYWPIHTGYGLAESGRTTSSNPPIQNLTNLGGIRESFVPRAGHLFASCDFPQLELYTWAQCCLTRFGHSKMAEALNDGMDPHLWYASIVLDTSYQDIRARYEGGEQLAADIRQVCKIGNFGWPGGMWPPTFTRHLRRILGKELSERLRVDEDRVTVWRDQWFEAWPEAHEFFQRVKELLDPIAKVAKVETIYTNRIRGGARICAACNNDFQGLGSDCAKEAGWQIALKQYTQRDSSLYNTRTVFFVHDEFGLECRDDDRAHHVAVELGETMRQGANVYLPDVPMPKSKMKPVLSRLWSKKAKQVFSHTGRLIAWSA